MQMLFQSDLGNTPLPLVLKIFDPVDYVSQLAREPEEEGEESSSPPARPAALFPAPATSGLKPDAELEDAFSYACRIVEGVHHHLQEIDERIRAQADNWRLERMPSVDRNILRLAIYELAHETDVPKLVVLDEAVELAKRFGSEQSGRFINGLLDGIMKRHEFPGSRA